ncbi:hypothetical protein K9N68_14820 [Kovacikia minuta CCNUW1]|uniref:hypothetical protein n=1 Tax=Kovacikia minuta TaxID=2931930 RepID=UPI001CCAF427|nr:hypothetical protein [Kovacikia minuta]UBF28993.1 hypothetical protein K9N68_14820 [Kovacikia minuta CCNUW1]
MKITVAVATVLLLSAPAISQALPEKTHHPTLVQVIVPTTPTTPAVPTTPPSAAQAIPTAQKEAGLEFEGLGTPSTVRITDTVYRGECPGEKQGKIKAWFYSTATPPVLVGEL